MDAKYCNYCKLDKPMDAFDKNKATKSGRQAYCKICRPLYRKSHRAKNIAVYQAADKRHNLKAVFGLSIEEFNSMLQEQNGVCAICNKSECLIFNGKITALSVDHCHKSGKIRALLCRRCNAVVGYLEGELGPKAIAYVNKWSNDDNKL